ncbi:MAG: GAF domain-containing protein [Acidobacteria bacterium]|nr:GAF domain-containing protein [Acidobacteriota bacterium]
MDEAVTNRWVEPAAPAETQARTADRSTPAAHQPLPFAFLAQLAEELNSTLELDQVVEKVAERVKEHINYDTFAILLLDDLGQELRFRFALGFSPEVVEHWRFGLGQGLVGTAAQARQAIRVGNVHSDGRYIRADEGIRSELAIPLIVKKRSVGVLDVASRQPDYFTEEHERLLTFLAGHLANAIENARLYENLREQARTLSLLHEVSRELTSILDREQLLRRVAQLVKRLINYQGFAVLVWNEETQLLEHTFSLRYDERLCPKGGLPLGYGLCGTAAALRQPLRVPNVTLDPRHVRCNHQAHDAEVRSELVVPLVFKDRLVGVLDLESTEYNAFTEQHEQMLSTLASYIAIALENARLYAHLRENEQRLASDVATAREIQRSLLPEAPPHVPGLDIGTAYEPARQLGGDVYDFLPYGDGRLAVAVGDVAGKATAAALYGSGAIGMLRGHVVVHPCPPAEMLELMNRHLHQPRLDHHFIALVLSVYDPSTHTLTLANAGFPRPLLVRGGQVETIAVEGVPLGLLPDSRYEEKQLRLEPGDVIVFCSDGIQDSMNRRQEEFGAKRLKRTLTELARKGSAADIAQGLLRATDRYAGDNPEPSDDRTVVVLKATTARD